MWLIVSLSVFTSIWFSRRLGARYGKRKILEIGYFYNIFLCLYLIFPAIFFETLSFADDDPISFLFNGFSYSNRELVIENLMRMYAFQIIFCLSYLKFRKRKPIEMIERNFDFASANLYFFLIVLAFIYFCLFYFSSDFEGYLDSYKRYDHLSGFLRKLISVAIRLKTGILLIVQLYLCYKLKNKRILLLVILLSIIIVEAMYSSGARITMFFIILQSLFIYSIFINLPKFKVLALLGFFLLMAFFVIEKNRHNTNQELVIDFASAAPGELGAVFFTSYHLYQQRNDGQLPQKDWKMLIFPFISPFAFNSGLKEIDPMFWYMKNYFPQSDVPPFTLGPIANSALWGGEFDLVLRSILNGLLFAFAVNVFVENKKNPLNIVFYGFVFSTSVMVLKYSILFHLTPIFKDLLLTALIFMGINFIFKSYRKKRPKVETLKR